METTPTPPQSEVDLRPNYVKQLTEIQQKLRTPERDIQELKEEAVVLARVLTQNSEEGFTGMALGALGGLYYLVQRMAALSDKPIDLERLAQRYAEVEMSSFDTTEEAREKTAGYYSHERVVVRKADIELSDHSSHTVYISHLNQTSVDGVVLQEGEMLHSVNRFPPPWRKLFPVED